MNRAEKAKATLDHEYIAQAFDDVRKACFDNIKMSKHEDAGLRDDMYYMLRAVDALQHVFMNHIRTGKLQEAMPEIKRIKR